MDKHSLANGLIVTDDKETRNNTAAVDTSKTKSVIDKNAPSHIAFYQQIISNAAIYCRNHTLVNCFLFIFIATVLFIPSSLSAQDTKDTVSIISFNDFHGKFIADKDVPGAARLVSTVKAVQRAHRNTIVVSGGDNFSGDIFSNFTRGILLKRLFSAMKVEVSAVGNHEFDWGLKYLKDTMAVTLPLIGANIEDEYLVKDKPWVKPYYIAERTLSDGRPFRVAFIGITTTDTPLGVKASKLKGIRFMDPTDAVQRQIINLRKENRVDLIVVLMHSGLSMEEPYRIEDDNAEMLPFIPGVSAIIAGHSHTLAYDKVNNIPVIQADAYAVGVNVLHFQVRNHKGIRDISYIGMDTLKTNKSIPDVEIKAEVDNLANKYGFNEKLTYCQDDMLHNATINAHSYTGPGTYITAAYAFAYHKAHPDTKIPVIGVNHYGGIRAPLIKGEVTYLHALNLLPFGGNVIAYRFNGAMLKKLFTDGRTKVINYMQTSNITFHVNKSNVVDHVWYAGKEIGDSDECVVVLDSYVADGSDGYDASLFTRPIGIVGTTTKVFTDYLRTLPSISLKKAPFPVVKND